MSGTQLIQPQPRKISSQRKGLPPKRPNPNRRIPENEKIDMIYTTHTSYDGKEGFQSVIPYTKEMIMTRKKLK